MSFIHRFEDNRKIRFYDEYVPWNIYGFVLVSVTVAISSVHILLLSTIQWKHFLRYWPFVWEIHRSPVNSPNQASDEDLWVNNREAGYFRCNRAHFDVIIMCIQVWNDGMFSPSLWTEIHILMATNVIFHIVSTSVVQTVIPGETKTKQKHVLNLSDRHKECYL